MEAPPVQFARTSDGVSIPYAIHGSGPPLLYFGVFSHLELDWRVPEFHDWMQRLGSLWTVVRYDPRGFVSSWHSGERQGEATLLTRPHA